MIQKIHPKIFLVVIAVGLFFGASFLGSRNNGKTESDNSKVPPAVAAERTYKNCLPEKGNENCYAKQFTPLAREQGSNYAFQTLFVLQQKDTKAIGCHLIAHGIGLGTYEHDPSNWQNDIRSINPSCSYGAIHGILENYVASLPGGTLTKEMVPDICGENPRADCNHIIGHLILVQTEAKIDDALDVCDVFKSDSVQLGHCYTGVFMEYQTALNLISHGLAPQSWLDWPARVPELERICRTYDNDKAIACWKEIVHAAAVKYNNNAANVFALCDSAPIARASYECKNHSVGILAATYNFEYAKTRAICEAKQNDPNFVGQCYLMLASSTLSTINTPETKQATRQFCSSLKKEYQDPCMAQLSYFEQLPASFYMESN